MFCPQCSTESSPGLQYCRSCGANLKVIGKAVALSEAIARSDRGPLPKLKEMVKNLRVDHVTEEVSRALERMNAEIARTHPEKKSVKGERRLREKKTADERREEKMVKGTISLFSGIGLMTFLYFLSAVLVLKLPPDTIAKIPFELDPVVHMIWLIGLIPVMSGVGHLIAGLLIRPVPALPEPTTQSSPPEITNPAVTTNIPVSVTENTTNLLEPPGSAFGVH